MMEVKKKTREKGGASNSNWRRIHLMTSLTLTVVFHKTLRVFAGVNCDRVELLVGGERGRSVEDAGGGVQSGGGTAPRLDVVHGVGKVSV